MTIAQRLYFVLGIMLLLISGELSALWFTIHTLSAVRAYVAGEGMWSKAEKDAAYHLEAYGRTRNPAEYAAYQNLLRVSTGDRQARLEMAKPNADEAREYQGLVEGRNHPADISGMIALFRRFGRVSYIADALHDWTVGDALMARFQQLASQLHAQVQVGKSDAVIARTLNQVAAINEKLTVVEGHFSYTLGEGSRWLTDLVLRVLLGAALTVELSGLVLTAAITRGISLRLSALLRASDRIAQGDYGPPVDSRSNDEIGRLAASFNKMTRDIARERLLAEHAVLASEASLKEAQRVAYIGVWEWVFQTDTMSWSKETCRLHGTTLEGFPRTYAGFIRLIHEDHQTVDRVVRGARGSGDAFTIDYRVALPDASVRWLCAEARVESDASGRPVRMFGTTREITERKLAEERLAFLAEHDPLTGLPNRPVLVDRLDQAIGAARRSAGLVALLFVDLDHFKRVNDMLGHAAGDRLLAAIGRRLKTTLRSSDTVARHGGDEFLIAVIGLPTVEGAGVVARAVLESFAQPFFIDTHELFVSASIGISVFPDDGNDCEALVRAADAAMYQAKARGRNTFRFYTPQMHEQAARRISLDLELRRALELREFALYWQPIVGVQSGAVQGAEALLRWRPGGGALRAPDEFLNVAEDNGLIVPIGEWAIKAACAQMRVWQALSTPSLRTTVNASARQLHQANFPSVVASALEEAGANPHSLEVEITEAAIAADPAAAEGVLRELHAMGVRLTLDDFGSGQGSLNRLKRLPIDAVKIDRSVVRAIATERFDRGVAEAIIALCHGVGLRVIAEGVESHSQLEVLRELGCDAMQGFYVSPPVDEIAFGDLLRGRSIPAADRIA